MDYALAKQKLIEGTPQTQWFKEHGYILEYGYSLFLSKKFFEAIDVLKNISKYDVRASWCIILINIILGIKLKEYPSFLQVRNFLEIDIDLLLRSNQYYTVKTIINNGEIFYDACCESYKFIGRALHFYGNKNEALKYYLISKDKFYNDAEIHYLLGIIYAERNEKEKSIHALKTCLKIIPEYIPAQKLLKKQLD
jgi:tetratricopeptide (TPR) repeat protein